MCFFVLQQIILMKLWHFLQVWDWKSLDLAAVVRAVLQVVPQVYVLDIQEILQFVEIQKSSQLKWKG